MQGTSIRVLNKKALDFSSLKAGQSQILVFTDGIDLMSYREVQMQVRIHGSIDIGGDAQLKIVAVRSAPSSEDPGMTFWLSDPPLALVTLDAATSGGSGSEGALRVATFPDNFGGQLAVGLQAVQDGATEENIKATVSVDLVMKG